MGAEEFEAVSRREGVLATIDLKGDVTGAAREAMNAAYQEAAKDASAVILNFTRVGYINSTGIAAIVGVLAQARAAGLEVVACGLTEHYRHIFEVTRLSDFMNVVADEVAARSAAGAAR